MSGSEAETRELDKQLAAILREYNPGQAALAKMRARFSLKQVISMLEVMKAMEQRIEMDAKVSRIRKNH